MPHISEDLSSALISDERSGRFSEPATSPWQEGATAVLKLLAALVLIALAALAIAFRLRPAGDRGSRAEPEWHPAPPSGPAGMWATLPPLALEPTLSSWDWDRLDALLRSQ